MFLQSTKNAKYEHFRKFIFQQLLLKIINDFRKHKRKNLIFQLFCCEVSCIQVVVKDELENFEIAFRTWNLEKNKNTLEIELQIEPVKFSKQILMILEQPISFNAFSDRSLIELKLMELFELSSILLIIN